MESPHYPQNGLQITLSHNSIQRRIANRAAVSGAITAAISGGAVVNPRTLMLWHTIHSTYTTPRAREVGSHTNKKEIKLWAYAIGARGLGAHLRLIAP